MRCRVYWGSHGCCLPRGHECEHLCGCAFDLDPSKLRLPQIHGNVGRAPYYGPDTNFYGEDAP